MMDRLQIVNYCPPNGEPLRSITRLSHSEAFEKAEELCRRADGADHGRFADFANYYPRRIYTEQWLYDHFQAMGGEPETEHPLYFVLQGNEFLHQWLGSGSVVSLPLTSIAWEHISFTFGDSVAKIDRPERKPPFLLPELYKSIDRHGSVDGFLDSIRETDTYIEAQLWSDRYLELAVNVSCKAPTEDGL